MSENSFLTPCTTAPPKISVLMTVFNDRPHFVRQAVESILDQTFTDFEFLILSDGTSRKDTLDLLTIISRRDRRLCLRLEPHRGLVKTLNVGISHCRAPLICRQDADDWSAPQRLAKQAEFMDEHHEIAVVGSAVEICQEGGRKLWNQFQPGVSDEVLSAFPRENPFFHGAICMRAEMVRAIGGYNERLTCSEDYDLLWRLCEQFGGANLPDVLYHHRRSPGSVVSRMNSTLIRERVVVRQLAAQRARGEEQDVNRAFRFAQETVRESNVQSLLGMADQQLLAGYYHAALRSYVAAIARAPFQASAYLKAMRWLVFVLAPKFRARLFGH